MNKNQNGRLLLLQTFFYLRRNFEILHYLIYDSEKNIRKEKNIFFEHIEELLWRTIVLDMYKIVGNGKNYKTSIFVILNESSNLNDEKKRELRNLLKPHSNALKLIGDIRNKHIAHDDPGASIGDFDINTILGLLVAVETIMIYMYGEAVIKELLDNIDRNEYSVFEHLKS